MNMAMRFDEGNKFGHPQLAVPKDPMRICRQIGMKTTGMMYASRRAGG